MSTRANIIIVEHGSYTDYIKKESGKHPEVSYQNKLYFYRHSDGYPEGTLPTLSKFMELIKSGKIRDDMNQSAGWLVILGAVEYQTVKPELFNAKRHEEYNWPDNKEVDKILKDFEPENWKVGAYEPTDCIHGDIEHLYIVDVTDKKVYEEPRKNWNKWNN